MKKKVREEIIQISLEKQRDQEEAGSSDHMGRLDSSPQKAWEASIAAETFVDSFVDSFGDSFVD